MRKNSYYGAKLELTRLIRNEGLEHISKDEQIVDKIFNLLTEEKHVEKIEGILISTEIIKFGGDISNEKAKDIYKNILDWWSLAKIKYVS